MRLKRLPFRLRLTLGFAAAMVILFGGLALLLHTLVESSLDQGIKTLLYTRADDLKPLASESHKLRALQDDGNGVFVQVVNPRTGRVIDGTQDAGQPPLVTRAQLRAAASSRSGILIDHGTRSRLLAEPLSANPPRVLVVGTELTQRDHALTTLSELLFAGGPVLLILTCLAGYGLAARALRPVESMSAEASRISGTSPGVRLPVPEANDELHRLGETLNQMLGRVEDALRRERAFVADVGHELRTPLAILKLELELALAADISRAELRERVRSSAEEVDRITRLAQDLLVIARAEQGSAPLQPRKLDAGQVLGAVATRFGSAARESGRTIRVERGGPLAMNADPNWVEQALTNMVSNALRYGRGSVVLRPQRRNGSIELHVLDDGPGFDPDFLECAFERFARADSARPGGGAGLGLSIVRAIAEAHGGTADAANRTGGGADVWLSLPPA